MNETTATVNRGATPLDAFTPALQHTKRMLFQPFDIGKWFILGFVIFLAQLIGSGGHGWGGSGNKLRNRDDGFCGIGDGVNDLQQAGQWVVEHLWLILLIAFAGFVVINLIGLVIQYIGSRGHFMFIECVMENKAEVAVPWRNASKPAFSLFLWRVAIFILIFWCFALLFALPAWGLAKTAAAGEFTFPGSLITLLPFVAIFIPLAILISLADLLIRDFVTPVMAIKNLDLLGALEQTIGLFRSQLGNLVLYLLFRVIIGVLAGAVGMAVACLTCCVGLLPVIYQTITAPLHVFVRSWTLVILEQWDPELLSISKHQVT